jgi:phospholipid/cholesterol/gamma-HCH transport system substrate-binding protein
MTSRRTEIRVGSVVFITVLIFLFSLIWLKDYRLNNHRYDLAVIFPTVGGLTAGDPVRVAGVSKGEVKEVQLRTTDVQVILSLSSEVQLPEDSSISIQSIGLMGEKFVAIEPGSSSTQLPPGQPAVGQFHAGMPEVMAEVGELIRLVRDVAGSLHETIGNPQARASIQESLENIRRFSSVLAELLDQQEGDLTLALRDLRSASRGFRQLVAEDGSRIDSTVDRFHQASVDLAELTQQLMEVSATFKRIADKIERGEGTVGEFVQDETLYSDLKKTVKNLDELIVDIKAHPKKYLRLELF